MLLFAALLLLAALAHATDPSVVAICHIASGPQHIQTQFRAIPELPFHALHGDCLGRCPCTSCDIIQDPLWTPCPNATDPSCVLAPCVRTTPPLLYFNCTGLPCDECQSSGNCGFCFQDGHGARGACLDLAELANATCARTGTTPDLCEVALMQNSIYPRAECRRAGAPERTYWGYTSLFDEPQTIPFNTSLNRLSVAADAPDVFLPGSTSWMFTTEGPAEWTLLDNFAQSGPHVRECADCGLFDTCAACQSSAGCAWQGGACAESDVVPSACPATDACGFWDDCQLCAIAPGCAWCTNTSTCVDVGDVCGGAVAGASDPFACQNASSVFVSDETRLLFAEEICRVEQAPDFEFALLVGFYVFGVFLTPVYFVLSVLLV